MSSAKKRMTRQSGRRVLKNLRQWKLEKHIRNNSLGLSYHRHFHIVINVENENKKLIQKTFITKIFTDKRNRFVIYSLKETECRSFLPETSFLIIGRTGYSACSGRTASEAARGMRFLRGTVFCVGNLGWFNLLRA